MTARTRGPAGGPADNPAQHIATEVGLALAALRRAVAAGEQIHDDLVLEMIVDDLGVVAGDLRLIDRDLEGFVK